MSVTYAESYHDHLLAEQKARKARIAARAVPDDGIDLSRPPGQKWIEPVVLPAPIVKPKPAPQAYMDECSAWLAAEHRIHLETRIIPASAFCIINAATQHFGISRVDLTSQRRTNNIVRPRQITMYLLKMLTGRSLPFIGTLLGDRDHTTVLHAVRRISELRKTDEGVATSITTLAATLAADGFDVSPLGVVNG